MNKLPGIRGYVIALLILFVGSMLTQIPVVYFLFIAKTDVAKFVAPGQFSLTLDKGNYQAFYQFDGMQDEQFLNNSFNLYKGMEFKLNNIEHQQIQLRNRKGGSYRSFDNSGISIFSFHIDQPGTYKFIASYNDNRLQPAAVIAIHKNFWRNFILAFVFAISMGILTLSSGSFVAYRTYKKRKASFTKQSTIQASNN